MNEMTSVTMNGSCVTMIVKISAGRSGARRAQSLDCRRTPLGRSGRASSRPLPTSVPTAVVMTLASFRRSGAVALGDVVRELLPAFQRFVDAHLPRDRGADVLG